MSLTHCFDAETPPATAPPHCGAVLGYIGGARAARVWTLEDWLRFSSLRQFPCYVPTVGTNPVGQAAEAVALMRARGWRITRSVIFDLENATDPEWWAVVQTRVDELQQDPVAYGSASTLFSNEARKNWAARWNNVPVLYPGLSVQATQYAANLADGGTLIDLSVVSAELLAHGGVAART
jgi:hypothetical protein